MLFQLIWLCTSYGLIYAVGAALVEGAGLSWGLLLVVTLPAVRVHRRFQPGKGYYLVGYQGQVGGDRPTKSGLVTRSDDPVRFKLLVTAEVVIVMAWMVDFFFRARPLAGGAVPGAG